MDNLYDVLEVSKKASKEIIEKAYKTLAKKYHPDLQEAEDKVKAEEMMKKLNEAYEILSDEQKREEYDKKLEEEEKNKLEENSQINKANENTYEVKKDNTNNPNVYEDWRSMYSNLSKSDQKKLLKKIQREANEEYRNKYEAYFRSLGYKVKHKWTFKEKMALIIGIIVIILSFIILWIIPSTHDCMIQLYNSNLAIRLISNIVIGIFKGINQFFVNILKF